MNPEIHVGIDSVTAERLKKGNVVQYPHTIDGKIFGAELSWSNWPPLWPVHKALGIPGYVDFRVGVVIGSFVPMSTLSRVERRLTGLMNPRAIVDDYREVCYQLNDEELEVRESGGVTSPNSYVLDRRKLDARPNNNSNPGMPDGLYRMVTGSLAAHRAPDHRPPSLDPFVLNYFRSAEPLITALARGGDLSRYDVVVICGELDPKRISWRRI